MSDRRPVPDASTNMLPQPEKPTRLPGSRLGPDGRKFTWGPVDHIHRVTPFIAVVQYRQDQSNFLQEEAWASHGTTRFHPYLRKPDDEGDNFAWRDTSMSYETLEDAIIGAIATRRLGPNAGHHAASFISRMLKEDS